MKIGFLGLALAFVGLAAPVMAQAPNPATMPTAIPATVMIPAYNSARSIRYQVQGNGFACVSWLTASVTITGTTSSAICSGAGAFLVTAGSTDNRVYPGPVNTTPLYGIAAVGSTLQLSFEVQ